MADLGSRKLYSAHDTTLMPLLLAMGAFDGEWPPFAADVAFELYEVALERC